MYLKTIRENDTIDLVCPASAVTKAQLFKVKKYLESIHLKANVFCEDELFANKIINHEMPVFDAEIRFKQLMMALKNPNSKTIWCLRGGYGSEDLLPFLKKETAIKQEKNFIGFGDLTSLIDFFQKNWGWENIYAPMLLQLAEKRVSFESEKVLKNLLFGKKLQDYEILPLNESAKNFNSTISQTVGGAFNVISANFATNDEIDFVDKFLFLEADKAESGEKIDRYFRQLVEVFAKNKTKPKAIILGNFLESNPFFIKRRGGPTAKGQAVNMAIKRFVARVENGKLNLAIFKEASGCLGHSHNMKPLIIGAKSKIEKSNKTGETKFSLTIS